jgi:hypothetical protein
MTIAAGIMTVMMQNSNAATASAYGSAGALAEQVSIPLLV